jgi:hypothetical protein
MKPEDVTPDRWSAGRNIFFRKGETWRVEGIGQIFGNELFAVEIDWYVDTGAQEWWYYAGPAGVGVTDGAGNHYNITPAGWGAIVNKNFVYTAGDLNSVPWINHPERGPFWHDADPSHVMTQLPDWPASWAARTLWAHKNFLLALCIDTAAGLLEGKVSWSSSADPGQIPSKWVPAPDNDAGDWSFATPGGPIVGGISVRDQFFVMKADATASLQYVGGQWVFQARDVFPSTGLYAPKAAIEHGNLVYMFTGAGEFIRHDGNTIQNLLYGVAQHYLLDTINAEFPASCFCYLADESGIVGFAYPTGDTKACTEAIGIEIDSIGRDEGPCDMALRDLPGVYGADLGYTEISPESWDTAVGTWDTDPMVWNEAPTGYRPAKIVFAGGANGLLELGISTDVLGQPIVAFAERTGMDLGDFSVHKVISQAFPRVEGTAGDMLNYRFGGQDQVRDAVTWGAEMPFDLGNVTDRLDFFQDGRLLAYSVRSTGGGGWHLNGIQLTVRKAGRW